jgi:hypothetical protein
LAQVPTVHSGWSLGEFPNPFAAPLAQLIPLRALSLGKVMCGCGLCCGFKTLVFVVYSLWVLQLGYFLGGRNCDEGLTCGS